MRALILGGAGMLGHKLWQTLRARADTYVTLRRPFVEYAQLGLFEESRSIAGVDAASEVDLDRAFDLAKPDVVYNCIGMIKQRDEAKDAVQSISINSLLPHKIARLCRVNDARLVQLSTDCVYSGARGNYTERDLPNPHDLYGRSKWLGEVDGPGCLTVRTSMVGRELSRGHGLLEWFLSQRGRTVPGFTRARFSGLTTLELSRVLADISQRHHDLNGVWHVAGDPTTKFDLLTIVNDAFGLGSTLEANDSFVCDRTLDASRFMNATGYKPPTWATMVAELAGDPTPYDAWANPWTSNVRDHSTASTS